MAEVWRFHNHDFRNIDVRACEPFLEIKAGLRRVNFRGKTNPTRERKLFFKKDNILP